MSTARLKELLAEYGPVAAGTYFAIFGVVLAGFAFTVSQGIELGGMDLGEVQGASVLGAAYVATKLTQPLRIGATLVLTPLVAAVLRRRHRSSAPATPQVQGSTDEQVPAAD